MNIPLAIHYPESDGKPMADNTRQGRWIIVIYDNLTALFRDQALVFIAADHLWYPLFGHPEIRVAPDVYVVFGRPRGDRGSYQQWLEGNIAPQVTFEILSPSNSEKEMDDKFDFYDRYGVQEYYLYDPETDTLKGWRRVRGRLRSIRRMNGWKSPLLGICFDLSGEEMVISYPDGEPFLTYEQLAFLREQERQERLHAEAQAKEERQQRLKAERRAERERRDRKKAQQENERLRERMRQAGIDPDA